jgi:UDP-N-acetylglucosamine 1-carboxyvinyltransferase
MPPLFQSKTMSSAPLVIRGGRPLEGEIEVLAAKNAALPIIIGSILSPEPVVLHGVPRLADVEVILEIVASLGTRYEWSGAHTLNLHTPELTSIEAPYSLGSKMRASFEVLGALLARAGEALVSMPGGCVIGPRPVDQHVKALRMMGATLTEDGGDFHAIRERPLSGRVVFDIQTVGGTRNAILAATLGSGRVTLENVALEPEVIDLANFLNSLGAKISGAGTTVIEIEGVSRLHGGEYTIIPDRMEAGTYLLAGAASRGTVTIRRANPSHMRAVTAKLVEAGVRVLESDDVIQIDARGVVGNPITLQAVEYPGFPTDLQPQMAAFLCTVPGTSKISDRIYPDRLGYAAELARLGANAVVHDHTLVVEGSLLHGAPVRALDIRAGAALIVAAAAAQGETTISGMEFVNRGYEHVAERLRQLGADAYQLEPALAIAL